MNMSDEIIYESCHCEEQMKNSSRYHKFEVLFRVMATMKWGFWRYLAAIFAMSAAMSGFTTVTALLLKEILAMAQQGTYEGVMGLVVKNVIAGIGLLLVYQIGFIVYTLEAKKGGANLQKEVFGKAMRLSFDYYENTHSGTFMSKVLYDCERAQGIYGSRFRRILMPCLMVIFYLIPMFAISWQVTGGLLGVSIAAFIVNAVFIKPMKKVSRELSNTNTSLTQRLSDILSGMELIKMFALDQQMVTRYEKENKAFLKGQIKMNRLSAGLDGLNQLFDLTGSLFFIALGIFFVSIGITTVDKLAAIYVMYGSMSWNFLQIGIYIPSMASYLTNAQRVFEFLELPEEQKSYMHIGKPEKQAYIAMEQIDFSYDGVNPVLKDFSLYIEKGSTVALKGSSGRGKSTVAKLLLGLYPANKGKISINGRSFAEMSLEEIRAMIGYVPQEPYLYDMSIAENIRLGRPQADMQEVIAAAKAANAHDFIQRQEKGYDTLAGERGNKLSGGEKQRIAIARAILKNAPILILDEATSALDNESERLVNEALDNLMKGKTTIMIAHRPSTLERAERIVEM